MCSPLCNQSHLSSTRPSIKKAVSVSCWLFLSSFPAFLSLLCVSRPSMCVTVFLGHFASFPWRPQVSHLQYLMWALIRGEELPNTSAACWRRSHAQGSPLIFHRKEKGRHTSFWQSQNGERHPSVISTHMHCQRFIVQGSNGALTHLFLSVFTSLLSLSHSHADTQIHIHQSFAFSSSSPSSLYLLSISHLLSPPFSLFFLLPLVLSSPRRCLIFLPLPTLIENKDVKLLILRVTTCVHADRWEERMAIWLKLYGFL